MTMVVIPDSSGRKPESRFLKVLLDIVPGLLSAGAGYKSTGLTLKA